VGATQHEFIDAYLRESTEVLGAYSADLQARSTLESFADVISSAFSRGNKLLLAGNGGSAADAQHIAGELVSRLFFDRGPLPAIALTTDSSVLTAIGNDYGYDRVFERQVLALGNSGDVFLGISTSGKSKNILRALDAAKAVGMKVLGFTGENPGEMDGKCELTLKAPSRKTAIIQQIHIVAAHLICGLVEQSRFGQSQEPT
jgi:D-sedoheptulose 7-phosphate isomerase